jgi:hypothetical protein
MHGRWWTYSKAALKVADTMRFPPASSISFPREYRAMPHPLPYVIRVHFPGLQERHAATPTQQPSTRLVADIPKMVNKIRVFQAVSPARGTFYFRVEILSNIPLQDVQVSQNLNVSQV